MKKRLVILGAGESGTGAALLADHLGYEVFVSDKGQIMTAHKTELDATGIAWEEDQHTLDKILNADEIIKSPGIPEKSEVVKAVRAKGINVIGEIEFGWRHAGKCQIVAITGSNGKTTTTELTHHLLKTAGLDVRKGGNVGNSFARMVLERVEGGERRAEGGFTRRSDNEGGGQAPTIYVLEVSSFQLDDIQHFRPKIAMLLNITPDHLDRYDYQLEKYAASKFRVTMNQQRGDKFIYNGFDPIVASGLTTQRRMTASQPQQIAIRKGFFKNGQIKVGKEAFGMTKTALRGPHNMFNAACATRAALLLGAEAGKIQEGLNTFVPPPHRLEMVAKTSGITWINDSKATNVDSVFYALQAMDTPTVWIVGGQDKGNDYSPLLKLVKKKVKAIVCMGVENSKIMAVFGKMKKPVAETNSAEAAVKAAAGFAAKGDTVLLSPACASFDLFKNYEDRGEQFREAVLKLKN